MTALRWEAGLRFALALEPETLLAATGKQARKLKGLPAENGCRASHSHSSSSAFNRSLFFTTPLWHDRPWISSLHSRLAAMEFKILPSAAIHHFPGNEEMVFHFLGAEDFFIERRGVFCRLTPNGVHIEFIS